MVGIIRMTYERNYVETMVDSDGILWLNEKHIEEGLDYKNLQMVTVKYLSDPRKQRYELENEPKRQRNRIFMHKELTTKVFMDCRRTAAHKFRTGLGCKQYDIILTKEQSVLTKIKSSKKKKKNGSTICCVRL